MGLYLVHVKEENNAGVVDLFHWSDWSDPHGAVIFWGVIAGIAIGTALKLFTAGWDDWLDERWGRGSVRDWWLLRRIERDARR